MRPLLALPLLSVSLVSAADGLPPDSQPAIVNQRAQTMTLATGAAPAEIASAGLFLTTDEGQHWRAVQEVASNGHTLPRLSVTLPGEGRFGLATRIVFCDGRREADPVAGTVPALELIVDTTAPVFTAASIESQGADSGLIRVRARWAVQDAHLGDQPVAIEVAGSDGRFLAAEHLDAAGNLEAALPVPGNRPEAVLRFTARDLAGNSTSTPPVRLRTKAPRLGNALAAAMEPETPPPPKPAPTVAAPVASVPVPTTPESESTAVAEPTAAAGTPPAVPLPPGEDTAAVPLPPGDIPPATATVPPPPVVTPPPEPPAPPVVHDGQRPAPARWPYATGAAADQLITDARVARNFGHTEDALDAYEKALSSSRATDAAHEALTLLARAKRPLDLCTLAAALPPERCDDTVRLLHGRTLVDLGRPAEAIPVLAGIGSRSSEANEGQLLIARALIRSGRADAGRAILSRLAKGRDAIAAQARDDLGR
jgi:hypothetical protein